MRLVFPSPQGISHEFHEMDNVSCMRFGHPIDPVGVLIIPSGWKDNYCHVIIEYGDDETSTYKYLHYNDIIINGEPFSGEFPVSFDEYDMIIGKLVVNPDACNTIDYNMIGIVGEVGEVAELIKKQKRGDKDHIDISSRIRKEGGDILWYLSRLMAMFNLSTGEVAIENIKKLTGRKSRGTIEGSGEDR